MKVAIVLANLVTLVYKYMYMLYLIMKIDNIIANLVILRYKYMYIPYLWVSSLLLTFAMQS